LIVIEVFEVASIIRSPFAAGVSDAEGARVMSLSRKSRRCPTVPLLISINPAETRESP